MVRRENVMTTNGPHAAIAVSTARERFCAELFDRLWDRYRQRVSYVQTYEKVIQQAKATFVNDHIAFRTFATQQPLAGIATISRIFGALGYRAAGSYHFDDKQLSAIHFQHSNQQFPKLFISELRVSELPLESRKIIEKTVRSHRPAIDLEALAALANLDKDNKPAAELLPRLVPEFHELPWILPAREDVEKLNKVSQYAAWVLVHGYNVNHFTSLINSHGVAALDDIEKTIAALEKAGVPMKKEIEGERGSKLRQTATEAVTIDVAVHDRGVPAKMPWTYAYFELAQRDTVVDPATGKKVRFEGFLGPQATNLFEMTRVK
jgi:2-oxoadipate dioxygenase/decarboxylase-like protein